MRGKTWVRAMLLAEIATGAAAQSTASNPTAPADTVPAPIQTPLQRAEGNAKTSYDAAFFATYSPANAYQIVLRVPGFTLESGNQDVRGFGQAAGNVVINGQRPSAKGDSLEDILSRIPASRVARVEVGAGDLFGSEFSGKAQVVNLILTAGGGLAGTLEASVARYFTGKVSPEGSASALIRRGPSTFNLAAAIDNSAYSEEGGDTVTDLATGRVTEFRRKVNRIADPNGYLSASWELNEGSNRTAHLNGRYALDRFDLRQTNDVFPTGGTVRDDRLRQLYKRRDYEIGGDVTRPFAGGGLKLIGLITRRHRENDDTSLNRVNSVVIGGFTQLLDDRRGESVARMVWTRPKLFGWDVELGAEGVINTLDSRVDLFSLGASGARTRIDLPVDQAKVREVRGEAFVNAGKPLSPTLRLDLGTTYETSKLTVTGDAEAERSLSFIKPKATLDWRPGKAWHAQLSVARTVAQLQFEDFISSAELTTDRVNAGNPELLPQRSWEANATLEHPVLGDGLIKLEAGTQFISLVQDRVPTPDGFDAPGNLGSGRVYSFVATVDLPLTRLGLKGGRLNVRSSIARTRVRDPYTLELRDFSNNSTSYVSWTLRQDLNKFAWVIEGDIASHSTAYRLDELDRFLGLQPYLRITGEYRPTKQTTISLALDNILNEDAVRARTFFSPDRRNRVPFLFETRERNRHVTPILTVKHSFG